MDNQVLSKTETTARRAKENDMAIKLSRAWSMPCANTFNIPPIRELIDIYCRGVSIDPFANSSKIASITNDLDEAMDTDYHMDALDFLRTLGDKSIDTVLFDPPYTTRQVSEHYKRLNKTVTIQDTQSSFWGNMKREIGRVVKHGGHVITFGWNSGGMGKSNGFEIVEVLLVAHGGWHNDTIVTVDRKVPSLFDQPNHCKIHSNCPTGGKVN